jgi:hypothetical protein
MNRPGNLDSDNELDSFDVDGKHVESNLHEMWPNLAGNFSASSRLYSGGFKLK